MDGKGVTVRTCSDCGTPIDNPKARLCTACRKRHKMAYSHRWYKAKLAADKAGRAKIYEVTLVCPRCRKVRTKKSRTPEGTAWIYCDRCKFYLFSVENPLTEGNYIYG